MKACKGRKEGGKFKRERTAIKEGGRKWDEGRMNKRRKGGGEDEEEGLVQKGKESRNGERGIEKVFTGVWLYM